MTIGGALSELDNLLKADDIPCYYKPSIKAVMDTIALEQEPFINKPCISSSVCEHDKNKILDKIRAEIDEQYDRVHPYNISCAEGLEMALEIIDKYKVESESQESDTEKLKEWSHKPCINYEDGCEGWAGCPCVYYKCRK